ncbi:MAG TPA: PrsW family glutamic-type intramembrane protease [bacterium]|nr:PrsW family glutamic-type intramembrane protease [bacterium]
MVWLLALAIAPGVFWLWYFLRRDRLRPEPRHLVGRVFALGAAAAVAAGGLEAGTFALRPLEISAPFLPSSVVAATIVGLIEEAVKLAALYVGIFRHVQFDEVIDGIIYAVAASLGFATVENVAYVLQGGVGVGLLRALLSVPGHAFFGAVMGFYVGVARFAPRPWPWLGVALLAAAASHAAYDAAVFTGRWVALLVIPVVVLLWRASLHYVRRAQIMDTARRSTPPAP